MSWTRRSSGSSPARPAVGSWLSPRPIVEADPELHDQRVGAERARRYVGMGRTDEFGLRTAIARIEAGDAVWVEATIAEAESSDDGPSRATDFPADLLDALLDALRRADLSPLPRRVEGLGPVSISALAGLLRRTRLTVRPVCDLSSRVRSICYEHPESLKEQTHLTTGGDYWPYATSTSRRVDYDHPTPFTGRADSRPPPAQAGSHNSGRSGRRHHRWKTHAGYRSRQCGEGRYVWLTPHGLAFLVDHLGTRRIDPHQAQSIFEAPPGVDLYFT